jgi:biopolymer transport protein ExbB
MPFYILQAATTLVDSLNKINNLTNKVTPTSENLWSLLIKGGWMMIPLLILFLLACFIFIERSLYVRRAGALQDNFMAMIRDHILTGNVQAARTMARNTPNATARIIDKGLQRIGKPIDNIDSAMENVGKMELYKMEKRVNLLSLVSTAAPILGFLGTIIGMVQLFININESNEIAAGTIAGGIYTKLITSGCGLVIGLLSYVFYNSMNAQIDRAANRMEGASYDFLDILQEPTR